jgi:hypothetical protein
LWVFRRRRERGRERVRICELGSCVDQYLRG